MTTEEATIKNCRFATYEIIDTEKTYLSRVKAIYDVYYVPLKESTILKPEDIELQFGCWDTIYKISKSFSDKLQAQRDSQTPKIGKIFLEFCEDKDFLIYKNYLVNFEIAMNRRAILSTSNKKFGNFVNDAFHDPRSMNFTIESLLREPVSRVPRYKLLLETLIKYTPASSDEYEYLYKSLAKVTEVATENNEAIRARENKEKIMEIMLQIDIKTRINLLDDEKRRLIRSGTLDRQCRRTIKEFMFWLFSDKLLYGELLTGIAGNSYNLNRVINLHECRIAEDVKNLYPGSFAFTIESPAKSFVVFAKTQEEKKEWFQDINTQVNLVRQQIQADTGRIAPVWMPDAAVNNCQECDSKFTMTRRRHHCRSCGFVLCDDCTKNRMFLPHVDPIKKVRVCKKCFQSITREQEKAANAANNNGKRSVSSAEPSPMTARMAVQSMKRMGASAFDLQTFLSHRSAVLDEIDPSRQSAIKRMDDDDISPGLNCCNVCINEFTMFKAKQTCMNCGSNVCSDCNRNKFLIPHVDAKDEVKVCKNCYIKLVGGLTFESFAEEMQPKSTIANIRRKSLALFKSGQPNNIPISGVNNNNNNSNNNNNAQSALSVPPTEVFANGGGNSSTLTSNANAGSNSKSNRRKSFTTATMSYFDIGSFLRARYEVIDQIGRRTSTKLANTTRGKAPAPILADVCRCCNVVYNKAKNTRSECKNCGPNVCSDCCKKEIIVPYISKDKKVKVCNKCHLLLNSNAGNELLMLHLQNLEENNASGAPTATLGSAPVTANQPILNRRNAPPGSNAVLSSPRGGITAVNGASKGPPAPLNLQDMEDKVNNKLSQPLNTPASPTNRTLSTATPTIAKTTAPTPAPAPVPEKKKSLFSSIFGGGSSSTPRGGSSGSMSGGGGESPPPPGRNVMKSSADTSGKAIAMSAQNTSNPLSMRFSERKSGSGSTSTGGTTPRTSDPKRMSGTVLSGSFNGGNGGVTVHDSHGKDPFNPPATSGGTQLTERMEERSVSVEGMSDRQLMMMGLAPMTPASATKKRIDPVNTGIQPTTAASSSVPASPTAQAQAQAQAVTAQATSTTTATSSSAPAPTQFRLPSMSGKPTLKPKPVA